VYLCAVVSRMAVFWLVALQSGLDPVEVAHDSSVTVGRKASCKAIVAEEHAYVSGEHCRVHISAGGDIMVEDLSANGTFVNSSRVGKGKQVAAKFGDEISLAKPTRRGGALKFKFQAEAPSEVCQLDAQEAGRDGDRGAASMTPDRGDGGHGGAPGAAVTTTPREAIPAPVQVVRPASANALGAASPAGPLTGAPSGSEAPTAGSAAGPAKADGGVPHTSLMSALAADRIAAQDELRITEQRCEAEAARVALLQSEVAEARSELERERSRPFGRGHGQSSMKLTGECHELRERLARLREEGAQIDSARPAAEKAAARERQECAQIRAEIDAEKGCAERAELEASRLKSEAEEATAHVQSLRASLQLAARRNADLEESVAEAASEALSAQRASAAARQRLESRSAALSQLKGTVREHARQVAERLALLDKSIAELAPQSQDGASEALRAAGGELSPTAPVPRRSQSAHDPALSSPEGAGGSATKRRRRASLEEEALSS